MSCQCPQTSYRLSLAHYTRLLKLQLGPAYYPYTNGEVDIPSKWRPDATISPDWVEDCCTKLDANWENDELWEEHTIMLGCYFGFSTILLALFLYFRNEQPLKFRDYRSIILFWFLQNVVMTLAVMAGNMGGTGPIPLHLLVPFSFPSNVLPYYIVKSVQVYFIYAWNQAKLNKKAFEKIKLFHTFRFVLDYRTYFAVVAGLLVFTCAIPVTYALLSRPIFSESADLNAYNSLRCEWWQFPEEFQQQKSNSTLCACFLFATPLPGGSREECLQAVQNVCIQHVNIDPADAGFCETCLADLAAQNIGSDCRNWFLNFYTSGSCGHPAETPNGITCRAGVFADQHVGYICVGLSYFIWAVNIAVLLPLIGKQDDFGLILENILTNIVLSFTTFFVFAGVWDDRGDMLKWYTEGIAFDYRPAPFFTWIGCFWSILMTLGFPLILMVIRKKQMQPYMALRRQRRPPRQSGGDTDDNASMAVTDGGAFGGELLDEGEQAIEICVRHHRLRAIYSQFAVEAFHVENIRFLEDCAALLERAGGQLTTDNMSAIARSALNIYERYIVADSPMEINITSRRRTQIKMNLDAFLERVQPGPDSSRGIESSKARESSKESLSKIDSEIELIRTDRRSNSSVASQTRVELEALVSAFASAYTDIRRLLARDCWPRFKVSRFYQAYNKLIEDEAQLTFAVSGLSEPEIIPETRTPRTRTSDPSAPPTAADGRNDSSMREKRDLAPSSGVDSLGFDSENSSS